jgi:hypothetical protein
LTTIGVLAARGVSIQSVGLCERRRERRYAVVSVRKQAADTTATIPMVESESAPGAFPIGLRCFSVSETDPSLKQRLVSTTKHPNACHHW